LGGEREKREGRWVAKHGCDAVRWCDGRCVELGREKRLSRC
jgi:hypothetical protein